MLGGPIVGSLYGGRCPDCKGSKVDATFDPAIKDVRPDNAPEPMQTDKSIAEKREEVKRLLTNIIKMQARVSVELREFDKAIEHCDRYLEDYGSDEEVLQYQLRAARGKYETCPNESERQDILSNWRDYAADLVDDSSLAPEDVVAIWPDLLPDRSNMDRGEVSDDSSTI